MLLSIQAELHSVVACCVIQCSKGASEVTAAAMQRERERESAGVRKQRDAEISVEKECVRASRTATAIYSQALLHSPEMLSHLPHIDRLISLRTQPHAFIK